MSFCAICLLLPKYYRDKFSRLEIHKCQFECLKKYKLNFSCKWMNPIPSHSVIPLHFVISITFCNPFCRTLSSKTHYMLCNLPLFHFVAQHPSHYLIPV